jgi:hypothetical protein
MRKVIAKQNFTALKKFKVMFMCLTLIIVSLNLCAQTTDTSKQETKTTDTSKIKKHSPNKAMIMSAILPGLGQAYNKKYWKIPIIYAGAATVTYFAIVNSDSMKNYSMAYKLRTDGDSLTIDAYINKYKTEDLLTIKNYYRRNLELSIIAGFAIYALNIIDATVDAHLFDFDINDNLTMKWQPLFITSFHHSVTGVSLTFNFGKEKKIQAFKN